jgi:hypothetical protein
MEASMFARQINPTPARSFMAHLLIISREHSFPLYSLAPQRIQMLLRPVFYNVGLGYAAKQGSSV